MSIKIPSRARRGFSLLELLLVLTLAPVVFFALYSNFAAGLRIWSVVTRATPEEDSNIFFHKVRRDVENMMRSDAAPFSGDAGEMAFASAVDAPPELGGAYGIGQVRLYYDESSRTVRRETKDYSQNYREAPGHVTVLLQDVTSFSLSYLTPSQTGGSPSWDGSWTPQQGVLPAAVRVSFSTGRGASQETRVFFIPAGGRLR